MPEEWPPNEADLQLVIECANLGGQMPLFYTFQQRDALDPYQIAEELGEQEFSGNFHEQNRKSNEWLLTKHANTPILRDLYKNPEDFVRAVHNAMSDVDNSPAEITHSDEYGVYEIKPDIFDLMQLRDEVINEVQSAGVVDNNGKPIFENAVLPAVIWSKRIMKSYYGKCIMRGTDYYIQINKVLSSAQVPRETLKFLIYHKLLQVNDYWNHDFISRDAEWKYPDTGVHMSFLDSLSLRFKTVDFDLHMYAVEPVLLEHPPDGAAVIN